MRLTFITLLLLILSVTAHEDAYTACLCVNRRLHNLTCPHYVGYVAPHCSPSANRQDCELLCCKHCAIYGYYWPICRSHALRERCHTLAQEHSDDYMKSSTIGPMENTWEPSETTEPDMEPSQEDINPSEEATPTEPAPTPEETAEPTPVAAPTVEPPFDATNEGELDLSPANGRPFAPAACECMIEGKNCSRVLARASGVCKPGITAAKQGKDCTFACCRICVVNSFATYCDNPMIKKVCRL